MGKIMEAVFCAALVLTLLCACGEAQETAESAPLPRKISAEEAKSIMDSGEEYFLLDVRTQEEFDAQHIPDAVCIPDTELSDRRDELPQDKTALILVYCRSGRRSAASAELLAEMGYTAVCDFGGIIDWQYETVSETAVTAEPTSEHTHQWADFDCNYQQCTICGAQKRYSDPA